MKDLEITKKKNESEELAFSNYLQEIKKFTVLTNIEEAELILLIKTGDQKALEKLVRANQSLVVSIARQYENKGVSLQNLINEGNLALINTAQCFDISREVSFRFDLDWSIHRYLAQALSEQIIRLPKDPKLGSMSKIGKKYSE